MSTTSSETTTHAHVTQRVGGRPGGATGRPKVSFIAWADDSGRAREIAQALGGEGRAFYKLRIVWKPLIPLRYLLNAIGTCGYLLSRRPRAVIVTNPPIFPGLIAFLYSTVAKAPLLLDSHPSAFGDAPMSKQVAGIHEWLARRSATTMVTVPELAKIVTAWGGRATSSTRLPRPVASLLPPRSRAGRASCASAGSPATSRPRRWLRRPGWCPRRRC